jgi:hypothetical protein
VNQTSFQFTRRSATTEKTIPNAAHGGKEKTMTRKPKIRKQRTTAHARLREAAEAANYTPSCGDNWVAQRTIDGYKVFGYEASGGPVEMLACEPTEARAFRAAAKYLEAEESK